MTNKDLLSRNVEEILPSRAAFEKRLKAGPIKIYFGVDPTSHLIHIGNAVALWKLREFQEAGHKVILLIGDFTGMIGDPTGRDTLRVKLTREEVLKNAKTYQQQAEKILNFSGKNPASLVFNSSWLAKLSFKEIINLASHFTAQQMLERDFFQIRIREKKPIFLHEFLYPLMQGYDSVAMDVDAEIGGTDQTFNMLVGRTLVKAFREKEKFVISTPLLPGLDGRKMSKSFGNFIAITEKPGEMFGKVMSLHDKLISTYFKLATKLSQQEIKSIISLPPMDAKKRLAYEIVAIYHGQDLADKARREFEDVFQKGKSPQRIPMYKTRAGSLDLVDVLAKTKLVKSRSEARRLILQGGVEWEGKKIAETTLHVASNGTLKVGKYRFLQIKIQ